MSTGERIFFWWVRVVYCITFGSLWRHRLLVSKVMKFNPLVVSIATLCLVVVNADAQTADVLTQTAKSNVVMSAPVTVSFEWLRPTEGPTAKDAIALLRHMKFMVTTSTTVNQEPKKPEYRLVATWTGIVDEPGMKQLIARLAVLTDGEGSAKWQITQVRP